MIMEELFLRYFNISLRASWLILFILVIRFIFKRAPKRLRILLWAIAAFRLLCPLTFESPFSLLPKGDTIPMDIATAPLPQIDTGISSINNAVNPVIISNFRPSPENSANPLQIVNYIASIVWIIGMAGMILWLLVSSFRLHRRMNEAMLLEGNVYESGRTDSAFVFGIFKPKIYLPLHLSDTEKQYIIAHEKAHIAHGDHLLKPLAFLVLAVHWYNPLVWLAYSLFTKDIEYACDETVLSGLNENEHADYAAVLLKNAAHGRLAVSPAAFGESGVKNRIRTILDYRTPSFWAGIVVIVLTVIAAVSFLSDPAKADEGPEITPAVPDQTPDAEPVPVTEPVLRMEDWTNGSTQVLYQSTDKELISRFETLLGNVMTLEEEGVIRMNEGYENIMNYHISSDAGFIGYEAGRFPYGSVMHENMLYVEAGTIKDGTVVSVTDLLIPADSETAKRLQDFVSEVQSVSNAQVYDPARDPDQIREYLTQLTGPTGYRFPICNSVSLTNADEWNRFEEKVNQSQPASITLCNYTIEGDPIYTFVHYNGEDFAWFKDSSRDRFGSEQYAFETGVKKYLSHQSALVTDEEYGEKYYAETAVLSDLPYESYEEIAKSGENGDEIIYLWGFTYLSEN